MKTVADTLGVSRSNLAERLKGKSKPEVPTARLRMQTCCQPFVRWLMHGRPTAIGGLLPFSIGKGELPISQLSTSSVCIASGAIMPCPCKSTLPCARGAFMTARS